MGKKKTNVMFIGDGKGSTFISGGKSIQDNITTFRTASFGKFRLLFAPSLFTYSQLNENYCIVRIRTILLLLLTYYAKETSNSFLLLLSISSLI